MLNLKSTPYIVFMTDQHHTEVVNFAETLEDAERIVAECIPTLPEEEIAFILKVEGGIVNI